MDVLLIILLILAAVFAVITISEIYKECKRNEQD